MECKLAPLHREVEKPFGHAGLELGDDALRPACCIPDFAPSACQISDGGRRVHVDRKGGKGAEGPIWELSKRKPKPKKKPAQKKK